MGSHDIILDRLGITVAYTLQGVFQLSTHTLDHLNLRTKGNNGEKHTDENWGAWPELS